MVALRLAQDDDDRDADATAETEADDFLAMDAASFIRWPWATLDGLVGGLAPGTVTSIVGFSGRGKTTYLNSAILKWAEEGIKVDVLPLEISPAQWSINIAALEAGYDPGFIPSGNYLRAPDAELVRQRVKDSLRHLRQGLLWDERMDHWQNPVRVHSTTGLDVAALAAVGQKAAQRNARILCIDHIDELSENADDLKAAYAVNTAARNIAKQYGLAVIAMSQANNASMAGHRDKLASFGPPNPNEVMWGSKKRNLATTQLGLHRIIREPRKGESIEDFKAVVKRARDGDIEPWDVLVPNAMGVTVMKSRPMGGNERKRAILGVKQGRVTDYEQLPYSLR